MAKLTLLFALAATILSLSAAAFSATAINPHKIHNLAAAAPPPHAFRNHPHKAQPHSSAAKRKHRSHAHAKPPAAPSPTAVERGALPPEPYPGFFEFTEKCLEKLTEECGLEIFQGIFWEEEEAVISRKCCRKLVAVGRSCHEGILKATLQLPELPKREKDVIKRRDAHLWSQCISISDPHN